MFFFFFYLYWMPRFLHYINSFGAIIKKFRLDRTHVAKLNYIWHKNLKKKKNRLDGIHAVKLNSN